jgi:2,3-bisphosphoglycerate-independent phosphoglycerate mutase
MRVLFIFLDGIGLGEDNQGINPFANAQMPNLNALLEGRLLFQECAPFHGNQASLLAIDPNLGVDGLPQSATGQAVLMTGINIPAELGYHYGPKPNPEVAAFLKNRTLFSRFVAAGRKAALLNAYPPRYFDGIDTGKRLYSSIPMAVTNAGIPLFTHEDFFAGHALSADFTGNGWRQMLGFPDAPVLTAHESGRKLISLAKEYDFSLFEYWASDYAGHKQDMQSAVELMETFDGVLGGILEMTLAPGAHLPRAQVPGSAGVNEEGSMMNDLLVVVTSDHGNMEDLSTRKHTAANVPALVIGNKTARDEFTRQMTDLTHIAPAIWRAVTES